MAIDPEIKKLAAAVIGVRLAKSLGEAYTLLGELARVSPAHANQVLDHLEEQLAGWRNVINQSEQRDN